MVNIIKIIHRINSIGELKNVPREFGVEVDIRAYNGKLILNHEPFGNGELLSRYLDNFSHSFIILEIKEEGIEKEVIKMCSDRGIKDYFLLSVSFPFICILSDRGFKKLAARYSEFESIDSCISLKNKIEWVWADTFTKLPLNKESYRKLKNADFKICLVSPERWGRPEDIEHYKSYLKSNNINIDAVMTEIQHIGSWKDE